MSVPQKVKEGPASALRAMFAGVGSLLSAVDKVRGKSATPAPAAAASPAPAPTAAAAPEATAEAEAVAEPAAVAAETATAGETPAAETVAAETVAAESVAAEEAAAPETVAPEATAGLPLANYDESTVASLRARLRNLSADQLTQLIEYERGHAARADVITMFERRIAKIESEA